MYFILIQFLILRSASQADNPETQLVMFEELDDLLEKLIEGVIGEANKHEWSLMFVCFSSRPDHVLDNFGANICLSSARRALNQ